jgi:hypothetical protein
VRAGFHKKKGIVMLDHCKTHSVFITGLAAGVVALAAAKPIYADCGQNLDHAKTEEKVDGAWDKGKIDGNSVVTVTAASIHLCEKVDGASQATLTATRGAIVIDGKIDGGSKVVLRAAGAVTIGEKMVAGGKVDGRSSVEIWAEGPIVIRGKVDGGSTVNWCAPKLDVNGKIDGNAKVQKMPGCKY